MLRLPFVALACLAALPIIAARAEPEAAVPAASAPPAISVSATGDGAPHIAAAAKAAGAVAAAEETSDTAGSEPEKSQAAAKPAAPPPPTLTAQIDLAQQTMVVSENGDVKYSWPISSGTAEFPTPRGTFRPQWVAKMWYSRKYDNAPMPNAVFINGGVAVHATQHVRSLGQPASHGCIRLAPGNAKIFYNLVQTHGLQKTRVSIFGNPKWRAPEVASREEPRRQRYVQRDDDESWFSSGKQYRAPVSAYDPRFTPQRFRQPQRYYSSDIGYGGQRYYYRSNPRVVYVQRPQRRVYYYNNGYGGGGGW